MDDAEYFEDHEIAAIIENHVRKQKGQEHYYETEWVKHSLVVRITRNARIFDYDHRMLELLAANDIPSDQIPAIAQKDFKWSEDGDGKPKLRVVVTPVRTAGEPGRSLATQAECDAIASVFEGK